MYKGQHMDKAKGRKERGWEVGVVGAGESGGREMETTVLEQQLQKRKYLQKCIPDKALVI